MPRNYYLVLGIPADSTQREVKAAYRRLVKRFHPDCCSEEPTPFLGIQEAYSVLGDPERRREYDENLRESSREAGRRFARASAETVEPLIPDRPPAYGLSSAFFQSDRQQEVGLFELLFGSSLQRERDWSEFEENPALEVALTQQQANRGGSVRLLIPARQRCRACGGRGGKGFFACFHCDGSGFETYNYPLRLEFPPGIADNSAFSLPLDGLGLGGSRLTIRFRIRS